MSLKFEIINPLQFEGWDELILQTHGYFFFHSSAWAKVLYDSYNYTPLYFTLIDGNKLLVLIPLMEVNSFLTGRRGVALPFSDYCDPILSERIKKEEIFNYIINYGEKAQWKYFELKAGEKLFKDIKPSAIFCRHVLNLSKSVDLVFSKFRDSTKRNIKKAIREGVKVKIYNSLESIKEYYRLHCITRKTHGLPPQPFCFFRNIYDKIISKNLGFVVLASYNGKKIAGNVYFHIQKKAYYKYGAMDKKYQHLRASNLVMWEAIQWFTKNGYESLCLGRTEPENKGLLQFKNGWGTEQKVIEYYKFNLNNKNRFIKDDFFIGSGIKKVTSHLPIPILKIIGSLFYKHFG